MRVIKNVNVKEDKVYQINCEECDSQLEIEKSDIEYYGVYGMSMLHCPCCGAEIYSGVEELDKEITEDNLEFPQNFHYFNTTPTTKDIDNEQILKWIKECISNIRKNLCVNENGFTFVGSGNTVVFVQRFSGDEEYTVFVCKNYYQTHIPFKDEDYDY